MPTIQEDDTILKGLRKLFTRDSKKSDPPARKMNELCFALKLIDDDEAVSSSLSAKMRNRLKKLIEEEVIYVDGERATRTYTAYVVE